eukprot:6187570-Pleurochrysis_carterae.AAC.2
MSIESRQGSRTSPWILANAFSEPPPLLMLQVAGQLVILRRRDSEVRGVGLSSRRPRFFASLHYVYKALPSSPSWS